MKNFLTLLLLLHFSTISLGQLSYAQKNIKHLCSEEMKGRGYVSNGELKAAKYIAKEFKKHNLLAYHKNYLQYFRTSVNTIPATLKLTLNNQIKLTPGVDFLIDASSPSIKGAFETILIREIDLLNKTKIKKVLKNTENKFLLIDAYDSSFISKQNQILVNKIIRSLSYDPNFKVKGIIVFSNKKLTWNASTMQNSKALLTINKIIDLKKISIVTIESKSFFYKNYQTQNVIGRIKGTSKTDSLIVLSAHYDHLGIMGKKTFFPGANDNASGIAMLLELAKYYSIKKNKPKYDILFIAFGAEELGLIGSSYFVKHPVTPLLRIKFMLNFDLAGTGEEGIKVVNGTQFKTKFQQLKILNRNHKLLKTITARAPSCNSDHCCFYELNVPVFYIYTLGGIKAYHDIYDKYETLTLSNFNNYSQLMKLFINKL
jgi:aminopeptidase YwaD